MTQLICIVCPKGCHLSVDESKGFAVDGAACERGVEYGKTEMQNPTRVLTSTVRIADAAHSRCPVKTNMPIPKPKLFEVMGQLKEIELKAPVSEGQVVLQNICGTNACLVVTRDM